MANLGSSVLLSEAVSFLNGAHLNPHGHLSNLFRRCHQTLASASSNTISGGSPRPSSPSLPSIVLSELGVSDLSNEQLKRALSNSWTSLDSHAVGDPVTVCDVIKQCQCMYMYLLCVSMCP